MLTQFRKLATAIVSTLLAVIKSIRELIIEKPIRYLKTLQPVRQFKTMWQAITGYSDNPRQLLLDARALRVKAMRQALVGKVPATIKPENLIVDDEIEIDSRPVGREGQVRRLFSSRIALHAASRVETRIQVRQFALALLVMLVVVVAGTATLSMDRPGLATQYALGGAFFSLLLWGGWLIYRAMGLSARGFAAMMGSTEVLADADLRDARDFAHRVLVRATPVDAPADLQDIYRPLTVDAQGQPVDGQVVSSDYAGRYLVDALANGLPIYALAGFALIGTALVGLNVPLLGALISIPLAVAALVWSCLRLFVLRPVSSQRAIEAQEALRRSPMAKLVDDKAKETFVQQEAAKLETVEQAMRDKTSFIKLGTSTGLLAGRRYPYAPSHAEMPFGLSVDDSSMHVIVFGASGKGKTSGVLRPFTIQWAAAGEGGICVMDGKGVLPLEVADVPGFKLVSPGREKFSPIENLSPEDIADILFEMFAGEKKDDYWVLATRAHILASAKTLALLVNLEIDQQEYLEEKSSPPIPSRWKWTLSCLYEVAVNTAVLPEIRRIIEGPDGKNDLPDGVYGRAYRAYSVEMPALAEVTRSGILSNVAVWLGSLVNSSLLTEWADCESGFSLESILDGQRAGLLLPDFEYGQAGVVVTKLAKRRLYNAVRRRAESWKSGNGTRALLLIDEIQTILSDEEIEILPTARSIGLHVVGATQDVEGLSLALGGDEEKLAQLLGKFVSMVAVNVNTPATCQFVSERLGATYKAVISEVPAPVSDAASTVSSMQIAAGSYGPGTLMASASSTAEIAGLRGRGLAGEAVDMLGNLAEKSGLDKAYKLLPAALNNGERSGSAKIDLHVNITPMEVGELTKKKFSAFAVVARGGSTRADLIHLQPIFEFPKTAQEAK